MKFRDVCELVVGMRLYQFIDDDEYILYSVIGIDDKKQECVCMDEETFDLYTLTKKDIDDDFTLLSEYQLHSLACIKQATDMSMFYKDDIRELSKFKYTYFWAMDSAILGALKVDIYNRRPVYKIKIATYRYVTKKVFNEIINNIIKYNECENVSDILKCDVPEEMNADTIWDLYYNSIILTIPGLIENTDEKVSFLKVVKDEEVKLPDSAFIEIEELYNIHIKGYSVWELDTTVDLSAVKVKHFIVYSVHEDKYFVLVCNVYDTIVISQTESYNYVMQCMDELEEMMG